MDDEISGQVRRSVPFSYYNNPQYFQYSNSCPLMSVPYWRLSAFYFCYFATLGALIPYWSLYLKAQGFNPAQIGQLSAFLVGTKILAPNVWGWIADRSRNNLHLIRWTSFYAAGLFLWFLSAGNYLEFAVFTVVFSFFWNAPLPLYEAVTLYHLGADAHRYSRVRLWGSIGFILAVFGAGKALDWQPIAVLPVIIFFWLSVTWLSALATPKVQHNRPNDRNSPGVWHTLRHPGVLAFLAVYVLIQFAHAPYYVFYSIYLKQHGYSTTATGLFWALGVVAEIILFLLMQGLLQRFSLRSILLTSLFFAILRWWLIGRFPDQLWLLGCAQLLHAATFGGAHIAAIHFVHRYFDQRHQSKGQALYHSLSFGLGGMLGSWFSGQYWESAGASAIFTVSASVCALAWLIAFVWVGRSPAAASP
jgi:MFS transporter, PPP family, 3-phenylpropionic acid transporter